MININKQNMLPKVIAILIALLLWFYINGDQNPPIQKSINVDINYEDLSEDLIVTNEIKEIKLKIKGDEKVINNLSMRDFSAIIGLKDAQIGEQELKIDVRAPIGIEIVDVNPSKVNVNIDKMAEKQVPVRVSLLGNTAKGYSSFKPTVKPSHVVLKGPKKLINTIVDARVDVNLNNTKNNLVLNLPIKVKDKNDKTYGTEVFIMNPSNVEVFVPIIKDTPSKLIPIKPVLEGNPQAGYKVGRVIIEPETIEIVGEYDKLGAINYIQTEPINITGIKENTTKEVRLRLPSNVSLVYNAKVKVMIQVEDNLTVKTLQREIKVLNLDKNKNIKLSPAVGNITVEGNKEILNGLAAKDLELVIDVAGLNVGMHELEVQSVALANLKTLKVEPSKIKVEITKEENKEDQQQEVE
ncbi:YbbR domain-containing protein [Desulfonispora thiosulfatigenes DSM 11270]|uniref:YbbR domain-containing protein n=1 Tax=Desulfonispora thiosulfatigenes DSM 11270 TaxID=656914 RepID=A0A1W1V886_DESTI|nr:CdaR family protein [Desulfonispora thiosulfatigenes]SMB89562.1 YbbR domain-containing protein [Desulfonispora thiosulfatigenes DSM 11270]